MIVACAVTTCIYKGYLFKSIDERKPRNIENFRSISLFLPTCTRCANIDLLHGYTRVSVLVRIRVID